VQPTLARLGTRTVRWCTGQSLVRQAGPHEKATLETRQRRTAIIRRTIRWCTGQSGESTAANSSLSGNGKGDMAIIHRTVRWCTGLSGEPTVSHAIRGQRVARSNGRLGTPDCLVRVTPRFRGQDPGANIITRCAGTKSHTYDESWHRIECHIFII
jgi:hypothetical protein